MADHRQVTYNLAAWTANQRGELVAMLAGRGISHDWRSATTLVVADLVESEVDGLIGTVHGDVGLVVDQDGTKRTRDVTDALRRPAPLVLRAWAFLLDAVLMSVAWWVALGSSLDGSAPAAGGRAFGAAILALYFVGFVALYGQTPGKMAVRLRIVDAQTGEPPSTFQAATRFLVPNAVWVVSLALGFSGPLDQVWQAVVYGLLLGNPRRRGLHDLVAGTMVVVSPRPS